MKLFYVAGPYSAVNEYLVKLNIAKAEAMAVSIWQAGHAAICPHLNTAHWGSVLSHAGFIAGDLEIVRRCDGVVMVDGWMWSSGALQERTFALQKGIMVFYTVQDAIAWAEVQP